MSKRRKYSAEFMREAVQLATMPDVTLREWANLNDLLDLFLITERQRG